MISLALLILAVDGGTAEPPSAGTFWVTRISPGFGVSGWTKPGTGDQPTESQKTYGTTCQRIDVDRVSLRFDEVTFRRIPSGAFISPVIQNRLRPTARVEGNCDATFPEGTLFTNERDCYAARPDRFVFHCLGKDCAWTPSAPWSLGECEKELDRMKRVMLVGLEAEHAQALSTFTRFENVLTRGGTLYAEDCSAIKVTARKKDGEVAFKHVDADGEWELRGVVEPLFGRSEMIESGSLTNGGGGGGMHQRYIVMLGIDRVSIGDHIFTFDRKKCADGNR